MILEFHLLILLKEYIMDLGFAVYDIKHKDFLYKTYNVKIYPIYLGFDTIWRTTTISSNMKSIMDIYI